MKTLDFKISLFPAFFFLLVSLPSIALASELSCSQVDGMAIFGNKYGEWEFIGAIANEFDSDSIANEFGAGSEFKSSSIFNEFGRFGSDYSSNSAFNDSATKPPIIVNDEYEFVGYLTLNDWKTPSINTYAGVSCARNSFKSFRNSNLKDTIFKNIPDGTGGISSGLSSFVYLSLLCQEQYGEKSITASDPTKCTCQDGYVFDQAGTKCITDVNALIYASPYQNIQDLKIYENVRSRYGLNAELGCSRLFTEPEELAMCNVFSKDENKARWTSIPRTVTTPTGPPPNPFAVNEPTPTPETSVAESSTMNFTIQAPATMEDEKNNTFEVTARPESSFNYEPVPLDATDPKDFMIIETANVRKCPSISQCSIIDTIEVGTEVNGENKYLDWYEIRTPSDLQGWMHGSLLEQVKGNSNTESERGADEVDGDTIRPWYKNIFEWLASLF